MVDIGLAMELNKREVCDARGALCLVEFVTSGLALRIKLNDTLFKSSCGTGHKLHIKSALKN